jgi:phosphoribosylanthranilate isomerase
VVWVKVCGVRRAEDVAAAREAGADAVGIVVAESPRRVPVERARELAALAGDLPSYLVTVDAGSAELLDLAGFCGVAGVQPHGAYSDIAASAAVRAGLSVLLPVAVEGRPSLDRIPSAQTPLLDARVPGMHGGTGETFDWSLTEGIDRPFVLAGGLGPDNVGEAVRAVRPWGVDASSGLESSPGVKDAGLITTYVREAKRA